MSTKTTALGMFALVTLLAGCSTMRMMATPTALAAVTRW